MPDRPAPYTVPNTGTDAFTAVAASHEPPRTGPAVFTAVAEGEYDAETDKLAICAYPEDAPGAFAEHDHTACEDAADWPTQRYEVLLKDIAAGPGFEDASCVPDYDPRRHWVLVTISEQTCHAWVSLHESGPAAARSLAEDIDVHGIQVDEEDTFLYSLETGQRWKPQVRVVVTWVS